MLKSHHLPKKKETKKTMEKIERRDWAGQGNGEKPRPKISGSQNRKRREKKEGGRRREKQRRGGKR